MCICLALPSSCCVVFFFFFFFFFLILRCWCTPFVFSLYVLCRAISAGFSCRSLGCSIIYIKRTHLKKKSTASLQGAEVESFLQEFAEAQRFSRSEIFPGAALGARHRRGGGRRGGGVLAARVGQRRAAPRRSRGSPGPCQGSSRHPWRSPVAPSGAWMPSVHLSAGSAAAAPTMALLIRDGDDEEGVGTAFMQFPTTST